LSHFGISKKLIAVHEHNENQSAEKLLVQLNAGENIALVTDAGTPGISDPGAVVVDFVRKAGVKVVPIPGVSAVIAALSASGISQNGFLFHGFLPASGGARRKALETLKAQTVTLVFYEAPHRILESVDDMANALGAERRITFAREITKTYEKFASLYVIDNDWKEHLREMDELKQSSQNAVFEQKDPLLIYKLESFNLFKSMVSINPPCTKIPGSISILRSS
jgi:16S rRNA (cytidine1402-2'-O)-methyltransferase